MTAALHGRSVLVVGAGTRPSAELDPPVGIGRAIAVTIARAGAEVVCADIDGPAAEATADLIRVESGPARVVVADVADDRDCKRLADEATAFGIDGLVLNVGVAPGLGLTGTSPDEWDRTFAVNLRSNFMLLHHLVDGLPDGASIVFVASVAGLRPGSRQPAYDASKARVIALCRHVAIEVARRDIRANVVAPGLIDTAMGRDLSALKPRRGTTPVPLRRQGTAWEVASAVSFLLSREASYVTGQVLAVCGGLTLI